MWEETIDAGLLCTTSKEKRMNDYLYANPGNHEVRCSNYIKFLTREIRGAVSYFTHMLLRIINLKALGQHFQVRNPRWRPQRRVSMVWNSTFPDDKKATEC